MSIGIFRDQLYGSGDTQRPRAGHGKHSGSSMPNVVNLVGNPIGTQSSYAQAPSLPRPGNTYSGVPGNPGLVQYTPGPVSGLPSMSSHPFQFNPMPPLGPFGHGSGSLRQTSTQNMHPTTPSRSMKAHDLCWSIQGQPLGTLGGQLFFDLTSKGMPRCERVAILDISLDRGVGQTDVFTGCQNIV